MKDNGLIVRLKKELALVTRDRDFLLEWRKEMVEEIRFLREAIASGADPSDLFRLHAKMNLMLNAFPVDEYGNCCACGGGYEGSIPHTPDCAYNRP